MAEEFEQELDIADGSGTNTDGFSDENSPYPKANYTDAPSTNSAARGGKRNKVYLGGGDNGLSLDLPEAPISVYPYNQVKETVSGHVIEIDDTPGAERILYKHRSGSGIEMRHDGTVIYSSVKNTVRVTCCDEKVIVDGDGELSYNGNLTLNVAGDFDLVVGGNFNVTTSGDKVEDTHGSVKQNVRKNMKTIVTENKSDFTVGEYTQTVLGNSNNIVKGSYNNIVEGNVEVFSGGNLTMTGEDTIVYTAPNINIAAIDLTVIGDVGTIGGDNIIHYGKNYYGVSATMDAGVTAPTFHGDLDGTSLRAIDADTAHSQSYADPDPGGGVGSSPGYTVTNTATNTDATVEPTADIMNDYLYSSSFGVREVDVDNGDGLKNSIDRSADYGGVANRELTTAEIRSKLRDHNNLNNSQFIGAMISEGKLSPKYVQSVPDKIGKTVGLEAQKTRGTTSIGKRSDKTVRFSK